MIVQPSFEAHRRQRMLAEMRTSGWRRLRRVAPRMAGNRIFALAELPEPG